MVHAGGKRWICWGIIQNKRKKIELGNVRLKKRVSGYKSRNLEWKMSKKRDDKCFVAHPIKMRRDTEKSLFVCFRISDDWLELSYLL